MRRGVEQYSLPLGIHPRPIFRSYSRRQAALPHTFLQAQTSELPTCITWWHFIKNEGDTLKTPPEQRPDATETVVGPSGQQEGRGQSLPVWYPGRLRTPWSSLSRRPQHETEIRTVERKGSRAAAVRPPPPDDASAEIPPPSVRKSRSTSLMNKRQRSSGQSQSSRAASSIVSRGLQFQKPQKRKTLELRRTATQNCSEETRHRGERHSKAGSALHWKRPHSPVPQCLFHTLCSESDSVFRLICLVISLVVYSLSRCPRTAQFDPSRL